MKVGLVTNFPCDMDAIEYINNLKFDAVVGLGDVECPQYISNFMGILGEMESVYIMKYLKTNKRLIEGKYLNLSTDFSTGIHITHFPPEVNTSILNVKVKNDEIRSIILKNSPKIVIHGHSDRQCTYNLGKTTVISIGSFKAGYYAVYIPDKEEIILKWASH
ncbi:hypothetical protein CM19_08895 [Candidatus Acidianus copahuensis]|uniref:Metallophosphoesterase n=1 Tax=Candidatus Acidianus copahuensis TaxID=1160895 RepID=A0A031LMC5_9CREN|nr:hypothetical protein [Candidatus Acidianus copahuensis]EZQ03831.1 hypothetical protein CM19_08895 [Candidatus Acidianus copahuensis]